jgi:two-component system, LuxR family, sensor histidine kinase DctS
MSGLDQGWLNRIPAGGRSPRKAAAITVSSVVALAAIAIGLFGLLSVDSDRRARSQALSDGVWLEHILEQRLDVFMSVASEMARMPPPVLGGLSAVEVAWRLQRVLHPELLDAAWYDRSGKKVLALGTGSTGKLSYDREMPAHADATNPALHGIREEEGRLVGDLLVPSATGGGMFALTVSLDTLLARNIPQPISESYAVSIGSVLGTGQQEEGVAPQTAVAGVTQIQLAPPYSDIRIALAPNDGIAPVHKYLGPAAIAAGTLLSILLVLFLRHQLRERKRADARLQSEIAFRHSMEASLTIGLRAKDHDGKVLFVNPAFCKMIGYNAAELVGHYPPMPYWLEDIHAEVLRRQDISGNARPTPQSFETRFRRRDGAIINVQVYEAPLFDAAGNHQGWMGSLIDVTEQKRAAEQARIQVQSLQQTGRLVTMGEMASMIAHELNQPLSAIAGYATGSLNMLRSGRTDPETLMPGLERLAGQVERAGKIIRRIQDFTRKREPLLAPLQLAPIVKETCSLLYSDARAQGLRIVTSTEGELSNVFADPILIEQLLVNLVRNGLESMAANPSRRSDELIITLSERGHLQSIEVIDNGTGIDPAIADRLFETFTSTKPGGMGIGLNICRSIIELHKGSLKHRPNLQGGTVFTIELPVMEARGVTNGNG